MKEKPTTKLLKEARALLARRGAWIKGQYSDGDCYCMLGALHMASRGWPTGDVGKPSRGEGRAFGLLMKVVPGGNVWLFNDKKSTRKKDVLAAFDKAIELSVQS